MPSSFARAEREYFGSTLLGAAGSAWLLVAIRGWRDQADKCRRHEGESRQHWSLRRSAIGELREQDDPGSGREVRLRGLHKRRRSRAMERYQATRSEFAWQVKDIDRPQGDYISSGQCRRWGR